VSTQDPNDLRDPRLDAAWRAASHEEPPAALDDAIRAAARREVRAAPQAADARKASVPSALRPGGWWAPLAAAATIGAIAIGILQLTNSDKVSTPATDKGVVSDMPAAPSSKVVTAPAAPPPSPEAGSDARNRVVPPSPVAAPAPPPALRKDAAAPSPAKERDGMRGAPAPVTSAEQSRQAGATDALKPAAPVPEPFPAGAMKREAKQNAADVTPPMPTEPRTEGFASGKLAAPAPAPAAREAETRTAARAQGLASAAPPRMTGVQEANASKGRAASSVAEDTLDTRAKVAPKLAVPDWIALIHKLRDEGKTDEAAKELAAFRAAYPDHERLLPPDLRDWKPAPR
jgi:hypothetical protein